MTSHSVIDLESRMKVLKFSLSSIGELSNL